MQWIVYIGNFNSRKIEGYNIFDHYGFSKDCKRIATECGDDREKFAEEVRRSLMCYFWSRCEWEVIVSQWPPGESERDKPSKIDVYDQVRLNWDVFVDYVWRHKGEMKKL